MTEKEGVNPEGNLFISRLREIEPGHFQLYRLDCEGKSVLITTGSITEIGDSFFTIGIAKSLLAMGTDVYLAVSHEDWENNRDLITGE